VAYAPYGWISTNSASNGSNQQSSHCRQDINGQWIRSEMARNRGLIATMFTERQVGLDWAEPVPSEVLL
jgi:hypothetical protein